MGIDLQSSLCVDFGKFKLQNPIMTASGTFGYVDEFDAFLNVKNLGAIVTKGVTLEERPGNEGKRIFECTAGMINRIGLENVGIQKFIKEKLPKLREKGINFVLNIAGSSVEDYVKLGEISKNLEQTKNTSMSLFQELEKPMTVF